MRELVFPALLALAACSGSESDTPVKATDEPKAIEFDTAVLATSEPGDNPCMREEFEGVALTHCIADPKRHRILMTLGPEGGAPYRGMGKFAADVAEREPDVVFAMNGGMFDESGQPIGLYVQNGRQLKDANTAKGRGNFHLLPNGVFYGTGGTWAVAATEAYLEQIEERPSFATQSGPMLVIDGKLHPKIDEDGESRKIRNAVGVDQEGFAHFVISEAPLSFGKLARYYRDELKVANALYLDGTVSALFNPADARMDAGPPLGPLIVVEAKPESAAETGRAERAQTDEADENDEENAK